MMMRKVGFLVALALLASCGNRNGGETNPVLGLASQFIPAVNAIPGVGQEETAAPGFDGASIAANPDGFILVHVPFLGDPVLARRTADNGRNETWLSQNGFSASYTDGILVATRGLGEDLLAASVSGTREAIRAGGGTAERVHDRIGDLNEIVQESFSCTIEAQETETINLGLRQVDTRKYAETCRSNRLQFRNTYWVDGSGEIISSLQFVTQEATYLRRSSL